ncbi:MAG: MlrC C-terminal domain-containing protein, partial [SAR324 cluster bacterium]|nr:MlrC C-terminal domain-containing protein [SAR324 cluster bacterium]
RSCGLDPETFQVLIAKGVNSPLAAYQEVCSSFIRVDTPGVTASNLNHFDYQHRREPMFPFERDFDWKI